VSRKTTAQWRRDVPAYDRAIRMVEAMHAGWPARRVPRSVAHLDPETLTVSIILDGTDADCDLADQWLTSCGYRAGWVWDTRYERPVWRKTVTR
jgi:hypothetical protein